jgi:curved DNA-binding protein CbpA
MDDKGRKHFTDYFSLLEVTPETSKEGIKKAFMAKALIFHPDKAKTPADKKIFTKTYEDLQHAYRILSSDTSRKQYLEANQKTNIDLVRESRDVTYKHNSRTVDFHEAFNATRDKKDKEKIEKISARLAEGQTVTQKDVNQYIEQRNRDTVEIETRLDGPPASASSTAFASASAVQIYTEPRGFTNGIDEWSNKSNLSLANISFDGVTMDKLIGNNDISGTGLFNTEEYCPVPLCALETKIKLIQQERENFMKLTQTEFKIVPTEIEVTYSELFKPATEGLAR